MKNSPATKVKSDKLPTTVEEAVEWFLPRFDGLDSIVIAQQWDEDRFSAYCHSAISGIGMVIRNEMGFWTGDSALYNHLRDVHHLMHPDSMSDKIVRAIYHRITGAKAKKLHALKVNIGDWVITHSGKLVKISSDDMFDLKYEDIARLATEEENPEFKFRKLNPGENLHLENFWTPFRKKCPYGVARFCDWIDAYKRMVGWLSMMKPDTKFHHLPIDMQLGVILAYLNECNHEAYLEDNWNQDHILQEIIFQFIEMEVDHRNKNIKS